MKSPALAASLVTLNGRPEPLDSEAVQTFIVNVARVWEGLISLELVQARYGLTEAAWAKLADNVPLVRRVKEEMDRRIFNDTASKERAQLACMKAPERLESILVDDNERAREASKELRAYAHSGKDTGTADKERFHIIINLGGQRLEYNQPIRPVEPIIDGSNTETSNE